MSKVLGGIGIVLAIGLSLVAAHTSGYESGREKGQGEGARDWRVLADTLWVLNVEYSEQSKELTKCRQDLEEDVCSCELAE